MRNEREEINKVEIDLLTNEVVSSPLKIDEKILTVSASVLINKLLDFVRVNGSNKKLTPQNIFRKESV